MATSIQARWRVFTALKEYTCVRRQIILVQSIFHRKVAMTYLSCHKKAATDISAAWRRVRRHKLRMNAAITIQAQWRMFSRSRHWSNVKCNAVILQSAIRRSLAKEYCSCIVTGTLSFITLLIWFVMFA